MERLTERIADGILVKENHGENVLRTFYQCFGEKPNDKYTNCDEGYCAIEKLADSEDAEEQGQYGKWIPVSERLPEDGTYITTLDGELVGQEETFTSICGIQDGKWDEDECVIAWQPLPQPYQMGE